MIQNKSEYREYLKADAIANGEKRPIPTPYINIIWHQLRMLRKYEYHLNCYQQGIFKRIVISIDKFLYSRKCIQTGIQIGPNCFGKGLTIYHYGLIICNPSVGGIYNTTKRC